MTRASPSEPRRSGIFIAYRADFADGSPPRTTRIDDCRTGKRIPFARISDPQ
jgi:hypothetical protein